MAPRPLTRPSRSAAQRNGTRAKERTGGMALLVRWQPLLVRIVSGACRPNYGTSQATYGRNTYGVVHMQKISLHVARATFVVV
jgi:hypothetical protein